jgi:hypothetical protein
VWAITDVVSGETQGGKGPQPGVPPAIRGPKQEECCNMAARAVDIPIARALQARRTAA